MNDFRRTKGAKCLLLLTLLSLTPTSTLRANGMRLVSQDAFAAARGEAFAATADNPSAVYYNPAGLTQLEGHQFRSSIYSLYFDPTFQPPAGASNSGTTYEIDQKYAVVPQLFYSYSLPDHPLTLGLGLYSPHGAAVAWPQDTGFRAVALEGDLLYLRFNPVLAYQVNRCFSIAGGIMIDYGDISLDQGLIGTAFPFANNFHFEGDDISLAYNLGVLWQPNQKVSLGATLRSATTLNFKGQTEIERQPVIQPTSLPATMEYEFPLTAVFGLSYRPTPKWNIEFNADFTEWSTFDSTTIHQTGRTPFPVQNDVPVTLDWKDSWIYKFGVTRYFDKGWHGSVGYVFSESSVKDSYYSPLVADLDRHFLSVGVGRKTERFDFDAAYQLGLGNSHTVSGSSPSSSPGLFAGQNGDGTYDFTSHALVFSLGMHF